MRLSWECPRSVWTHLVARSPQATFFHSPAWADVARVSGMGEPRTLLVHGPDGRAALCVLGIRPIWSGLVRAARSGTAGGYGGLVTVGDMGPAELRAVYRALWRRFGECGGCTNPFGEPPPADTGFAMQPAPPTMAVRLAPLDALRRHYHEQRTRAIARYQKHGVHVRAIRQIAPDDWRTFLKLYELETSVWREQGRPLHLIRDERWFQSLQRYAGSQLRMIVATRDGETVGMLIYGVQHRIATELYVAWDHQYATSQVTTALKEGAFAECFARGLHWYDMMPSGALSGVEHFKRSFGATPRPIWEYYHPSWATRGLRLLKPARPADAVAS